MRSRTAFIAALTVALALAPPGAAATGSEPDTNQQLAAVRAATAQYHDVERAISDGYQLASGCSANMGFHYLRSIAQDATELDVTVPNILVYAPRPDGSVRLVAVEYASWEPASLFNRRFDPPVGVPFYTLHVWVWQANPDGMFAARNPNVHCDRR